MSFFLNIFGSIGSLADRIICVVFAVVLAQAPIYMGQYINVLSGAQMESQKTYDDIESRAKKYQLSVDEFIERLIANPDDLVRENAEVSMNAVERYKDYTEALNALLNSNIWLKPFRLMQHYDPSIQAALQFKPGVPLTLEGVVYGLIGVVLAMLLISLFKRIWKSVMPKKKPVAT